MYNVHVNILGYLQKKSVVVTPFIRPRVMLFYLFPNCGTFHTNYLSRTFVYYRLYVFQNIFIIVLYAAMIVTCVGTVHVEVLCNQYGGGENNILVFPRLDYGKARCP